MVCGQRYNNAEKGGIRQSQRGQFVQINTLILGQRQYSHDFHGARSNRTCPQYLAIGGDKGFDETLALAAGQSFRIFSKTGADQSMLTPSPGVRSWELADLSQCRLGQDETRLSRRRLSCATENRIDDRPSMREGLRPLIYPGSSAHCANKSI